MSVMVVGSFLTTTDEVSNLIIWTAAEISSLIMAASVPFIRLFVKNKFSSNSHGSDAQGLNERPQEKSATSTIPTTTGSSRPYWRTQSGDTDLLPDPPEMALNDVSLGSNS